MQKIKSTCVYCGCGCQLNYEVEDDKIIKVSPVMDDLASQGRPCIKGLTLNELEDPDRLITPLVKEGNEFKEVNLEDAKKVIYEKLNNLDPKEIAFIGSGEFINEDNFVLAKFARLVTKSNNIDCCARLCHAATTTAMRKMFGNPAMPNYMDDLVESDLIITVGTNPPSNYPVTFNRMMTAKKNGTKIISIDIQKSEMTNVADSFIKINFTELSTLFGGIIKMLIDSDSYKKDVDGFDDLAYSVKKFTKEYVVDKCGIKEEDLGLIVESLKNSKNPTFMHGMGITQHANGASNVVSVLNVAILTNANIIPMRGKINVQGAGDMGTCPDWVPFGGSISETKEVWNELINDVPGHHMTKFCFSPDTKALIVVGANPAQSMPDLDRLHKRFKDIFIIYINHHPGTTMEFANVVIPSTILFESDGTITNGERRVTKVNPVKGAPEGILPTWKFLSDLAKLFGKEEDFDYGNPEEIFEEIKKANPAYANLDIEKIKQSNDNFADKEKFFEKLIPIDNTNSERNHKNPNYPLLLTTQRSIHHFCTGELTRRNKKLNSFTPKAFCEISDKDAEKYKVEDGNKIKIESELSSIEATVKLKSDFVEGIITLPFHFEDTLVNKLFKAELDPISKEPNLKAVWVKISKI